MPFVYQNGPEGPSGRFFYRNMICQLLGVNGAAGTSITFEVLPRVPEAEFDPIKVVDDIPKDVIFKMLVAYIYDCVVLDVKTCTDINMEDESVHVYAYCTICPTLDMIHAYQKYGLFGVPAGTLFQPISSVFCQPVTVSFHDVVTDIGTETVTIRGMMSAFLERPSLVKGCAMKISPWGATINVNLTSGKDEPTIEENEPLSLKYPVVTDRIFLRIAEQIDGLEQSLKSELDPLNMIRICFRRQYICASTDKAARQIAFHVVFMPVVFGDYEVIDADSTYMILRPINAAWSSMPAYGRLDWVDAKHRIERLASFLYSDMGTLFVPKIADREFAYYEDRRYLRVNLIPGFVSFSDEILCFSDPKALDPWSERLTQQGVYFHDGTQFAFPFTKPDDPEVIVYGRVPVIPKKGKSALAPVIESMCSRGIFLQVLNVTAHWIYFSVNTSIDESPDYLPIDTIFPRLMPIVTNDDEPSPDRALLTMIDMCFHIGASKEFIIQHCSDEDLNRISHGAMLPQEALFNTWAEAVRLYERFDPIAVEVILESAISNIGGVVSDGKPPEAPLEHRELSENEMKRRFIQTMKEDRRKASEQLNASQEPSSEIAEASEDAKRNVAALQKSKEDLAKSKRQIQARRHQGVFGTIRDIFKP